MAENTVQFRWIVTLEGGLDVGLRRRSQRLRGGRLFWYPVEGHPEIVVAPDTLVVFGRPKGDRRSYMQWKEGNIAPQVVFEVMSPGNRKPRWMQSSTSMRSTACRNTTSTIRTMSNCGAGAAAKTGCIEITPMQGWTSPLLGIRFEIVDGELQVFGPDNRRFVSYTELAARARCEAQQQAAQHAQDVARLREKLRDLGFDPDA